MSFYQQNIQQATQTLAGLRRKINTLALSRLGVILVGAAALFRVVQTESIWGVVLTFIALVVLFSWLVFRQSLLERKRQRWTAYERINQNELAIAEGQANSYDHGSVYADPGHPYSDDLDIYGDKSLYAFVNRCATPQGRRLLADWLAAPAAGKTQIEARQEAVAELSADRDWCQQFQVDLFAGIADKRDLKSLLQQYIGDGQLQFGNKALRIYVQAAPFLILACFLGSLWMPMLVSFGVWLMIANLLATLGAGGKVSRIIGRADKAGALLGHFADAVARIEGRAWRAGRTSSLAGPLTGSKKRISTVLRELAVLLERLDYRLNMLVGALLNMVFVWDFRQVFALQDWQKSHGAEVMEIQDVVGEFEALSSLAVLSANHPHWAMPRIFEESERRLAFTDIAHPLIPAGQVVANDYTKEQHRIALITGSNMAGKSTFLRTVGVNTVLALCGAPVCAHSMEVSVMHMVSYMRIKDSLQESTSTFKAELDRMKMILKTVRDQPFSYFLIDEMLRGTNSVDKYRGSKAIIERLIGDGASGMVATHDLQLARLEEDHPDVVRNYHFDIQVRDGEMVFDYKLKNGACTVFNASILLRGIGIEVDPTSTAS